MHNTYPTSPQSCCASKASFFFSPQSAESAAGNIKMLREASSLFLILCLQPIFSSQSLRWRTVMLCYRWHVVLWRLSYRKYILLTQEYVGLYPYVQIMIYICALFTFDASEVHFAVLFWTSCFVAVLPVLQCETQSSLQRPDEFHLLPIIFPRFSLCAPPTRHLFSSPSTHMSAISWSALVSLKSPRLLVCGTFGFFQLLKWAFLTCWLF